MPPPDAMDMPASRLWALARPGLGAGCEALGNLRRQLTWRTGCVRRRAGGSRHVRGGARWARRFRDIPDRFAEGTAFQIGQ